MNETFWDHIFKAAEHLADGVKRQAEDQARERKAAPRRKTPGSTPFDGGAGPSAKRPGAEDCCITKKRFKSRG